MAIVQEGQGCRRDAEGWNMVMYADRVGLEQDLIILQILAPLMATVLHGLMSPNSSSFNSYICLPTCLAGGQGEKPAHRTPRAFEYCITEGFIRKIARHH